MGKTVPEILTLSEVAERYKFSERWVRDFIREHAIPVLRTHNKIRFDQLAIDAFEAALRVPPRPSKLPVHQRAPVRRDYREILRRRSAYDTLVAQLEADKAATAERVAARATAAAERRATKAAKAHNRVMQKRGLSG